MFAVRTGIEPVPHGVTSRHCYRSTNGPNMVVIQIPKKLGADFSITHSNVIVFTLDTPGPRGKMITLISMACKCGAAENRTLVGRM